MFIHFRWIPLIFTLQKMELISHMGSSQVRGQELLQALEGLSPWADAKKIQELLRLRQDYFLDTKWDPERSRFSCPLAEGIRRAGRFGPGKGLEPAKIGETECWWDASGYKMS